MPFFFFTSGTWNSVGSWLPLAKLVHDTKFPLQFTPKLVTVVETPSKKQKGPLREPLTYQHEVNQWEAEQPGLRAALAEVVALGQRARKDKWSKQLLAFEFEDWVSEISEGHAIPGKKATERMTKAFSRFPREKWSVTQVETSRSDRLAARNRLLSGGI